MTGHLWADQFAMGWRDAEFEPRSIFEEKGILAESRRIFRKYLNKGDSRLHRKSPENTCVNF
jgi:hypothetical protein